MCSIEHDDLLALTLSVLGLDDRDLAFLTIYIDRSLTLATCLLLDIESSCIAFLEKSVLLYGSLGAFKYL